jgi:hypothetical protein
MNRKPANRTTVPLSITVAPRFVEKLKSDALRRGFKTARAYLEALIDLGVPDDEIGLPQQFESVLPTQLPALLGHRTVLALEAVKDRIDAGEEMEPIAAELRAIRRDVANALLKSVPAYNREVDAREAREASAL